MAETNLKLQVEMPELYKAMCVLVDALVAYERTLNPVARSVFERFANPGLEAVTKALDAVEVER